MALRQPKRLREPQPKPMTRTDGDHTISILSLTPQHGAVGQVVVTARVRYQWQDGRTEDTTHEVIGSDVGSGPVVAIATAQVFVTDPGRYGKFAEDPREWMRRFVLDERK